MLGMHLKRFPLGLKDPHCLSAQTTEYTESTSESKSLSVSETYLPIVVMHSIADQLRECDYYLLFTFDSLSRARNL